uniref:NAD-specific glutamate dehydrogenase n=1 Tax=Strombidium inclinatum TaxID=197538 RepID=A0A7S3IHR1_9SPIT|mmetsp:Transcript_1813/g.2414  ORF Transcript_1813/g.2414 Transcript_1813/m.2414 type:complete len:427 (+) Transcript_1813:93-1373(+)
MHVVPVFTFTADFIEVVVGLAFVFFAVLALVVIFLGEVTAIVNEFGIVLFALAVLVTFGVVGLQEVPAALLEEGLELFANVGEDVVPVKRGHAFGVDDTDGVEVHLDVVDLFAGDRVDALEGLEVLVDHSHVEVLDLQVHSLEVDRFDVLQVQHEERELAKSHQAVFRRAHLHLGFHGTAPEGELFDRNIDLHRGAGLLGLLLDDLGEVQELLSEPLLGLALTLFLLELVEVVHSLPRAAHVDVIGYVDGLLEELDVVGLLVAQGQRRLESEVDDRNDLVLLARLEEHVLHVGEGDVNAHALGAHEAHSVLVHFQIAHSLAAFEMRLDDDVLKHFLAALDELQRLEAGLVLLVLLLVAHLALLDQVLDLLLSLLEVVVLAAVVAVLEGQLLHEDGVGVGHVGVDVAVRARLGGSVEVNTQVGPLAL